MGKLIDLIFIYAAFVVIGMFVILLLTWPMMFLTDLTTGVVLLRMLVVANVLALIGTAALVAGGDL